MIDCREFKLSENPFPPGSFAAALYGSARDRWYWWYWKQRSLRSGRVVETCSGEIGTWYGVKFVR